MSSRKPDDVEIQRADPQARRSLIIALVVVVTTGLLLQVFLGRYLAGYREDLGMAVARLQNAVAILYVLSLPMLYYGIVMFRIGRRSVVSERYPPPDTPVVKDTVVRRAAAAKRWGYALQVTSVLIMLTVVVVPVAISLLMQRLLGAA